MLAAARQSLAPTLCLAWLLGWALPLAAAEDAAAGRKIYRQMCAECHGPKGEGVSGKYDTALAGNWSITKLTRVIENTMPEEDPDLCVGEDAVNVARFIYDEFYSPEARAKNTPARVELVRLTNPQHLNAVADLVKSFTGPDRLTEERGLRATYYNARGFNRDKLVRRQVDAPVDFDFGTNSPDQESIAEDEFSMQWRGSVIAEETGIHEFVVRTPNGFRLWVNDTEEPLIDGWVASGDLAEHRATLRLIGGRVYPLRMDYFKSKDKTASVSLQWQPPHGALQPIPKRNLTPQDSGPTLVLTTPFPPDDASVGYERGVSVSKAWNESATFAAIEAANYVAQNVDRLAGTKHDATNRTEQVRTFARRFVETAFRRPLTPEQARTHVDAQWQRTEKLETAVKNIVLLTLTSPHFLYLGLGDDRADDYTVAARLAFGLWDSLPDQTLFEQAAAGRLRTPEQVTAQAKRMLEDPRAHAKLRTALHHWLQMSHVEDLSKDGALYPGFTDEVIADLRVSLDLFLADAVWGERSDYRDLLLADQLYVNERLAKFYGIEGVSGPDFVKVAFDRDQRSGVLTHPYLLAAFSYHQTTSPIHRGVFLTRNIVGRSLKPPPSAVAFEDSKFDPHLTMREKVAELTRSDACMSCHSVINPLGFSLEHFDAVGRFRTTEKDRAIDAVSDYLTNDGETIRLTGARDVARYAADSELAQTAFVEHLFHQVVKQPALAYGPRTLNQLRASFAKSDYNIRALLTEIATVAALHGIEKNIKTADVR